MFNMSSITKDNFAKASRHVPNKFSAQVFIDLVAQLNNAGTHFHKILWPQRVQFSFKYPHKKSHMGLNPGLKEAKRIPRDGTAGNNGTSHNCQMFRTALAVCGAAPFCINHCVFHERLVARRCGTNSFSNIALYRATLTVSLKKTGPITPWLDRITQTDTFSLRRSFMDVLRFFSAPKTDILFIYCSVEVEISFIGKPCVEEYFIFFHLPTTHILVFFGCSD